MRMLGQVLFQRYLQRLSCFGWSWNQQGVSAVGHFREAESWMRLSEYANGGENRTVQWKTQDREVKGSFERVPQPIVIFTVESISKSGK